MRDGRYIHTLETSKTSKAELIKLMVGRDISDSFPMRNTALGDVVLKVENVTARVWRISLSTYAGGRSWALPAWLEPGGQN